MLGILNGEQLKMATIREIMEHPEGYLCGEQKKVYSIDTAGPIMVRGCAGSGKTLVAIARARFLDSYAHGLFGHAKIGFFTYDTSLRKEVTRYLENTKIKVDNIDRWVNKFLREQRGYKIGMLPTNPGWNGKFHLCLQQAKLKVFGKQSGRAICMKSNGFYKDEIEWIKYRQIEDEETYLNTPRVGRGTADRVSSEDRHLLWGLKVAYDEYASAKGLMLFEDLINAAVKELQKRPLSEDELFSYVIVDEAQDFTLAKLRLISLITAGLPEKKNLTLFADAAQQIYQCGFSWKEANISIAGRRSYAFNKNYRNTRQIAEAACSLMSHEEDQRDMTQMELPAKSGEKPLLVISVRKEAVLDVLIKKIAAVPQGERIAFAAYGKKNLDELKMILERKGFGVRLNGKLFMNPFELDALLDSNDEANAAVSAKAVGATERNRILDVYSLYKLKGLQFEHVVLWDITEGSFPPLTGHLNEYSRFRMLLYVAMTRACSTLTLCSFGKPSPLLREIDSSLLDVKQVTGDNKR